MAKKGGVQQLQAEISNDEEFEYFLERPGLIVLDVYSDWCGPCLGMVGSLKKIKLEMGGDNLHLAICKADTISYLHRFHKKSEPTWLFITNGKAVNLMFGTNVPKLTKLIEQELKLLNNKNRTFYEITEMQPEEVVRKRKKDNALLEAERAVLNEKDKKRRDYLNYVTDTIMDNLPDIGVTLFGPQVNRDMIKKIMEPADTLRIQCKDRKVTLVLKDYFEVINYACGNPIDPEVLDQLDQKELLVCFWKMPEDNRRPVEEILAIYAHELMKQRVEPVDEFSDEVQTLPPIITPMDISYDIELHEGDEGWDEAEPGPGERKSRHKSHLAAALSAILEPDADLDNLDGDEDEEGDGEGGDFGMELDLDETILDFEIEEEEEEVPAPKIRTKTKTVTVPPIWVPNNHRTHAAMIYIFFRQQTGPFLPPDPVPEPPHVIMAFDAYKRKDLIGLAERNKEDIPLYGFFTSDDADETTYLANSAHKYMQGPHNAGDKIVLKVNKQTSNTMLSLATYGPSYVSPSTQVGHEESLKFFPKTYKTAAQEEEERRLLEESEPKKKKKSKKSVRPSERPSISKSINEEAPAPALDEVKVPDTVEESGPKPSGEDTAEIVPPTVEVAEVVADEVPAVEAEVQEVVPEIDAAPPEPEPAEE